MLGPLKPLPERRPAECLTAGVTADDRRFLLCLVAAHYGRAGAAIFTEVTPEDGADGEPKANLFEDVGTWCIDGSDEGPSILKVDFMPSDDLSVADGVAVVNALLEQVGSKWSDTVERWTP